MKFGENILLMLFCTPDMRISISVVLSVDVKFDFNEIMPSAIEILSLFNISSSLRIRGIKRNV